ncbi:MAG: phosphoribosylaminoimidazole-succinocarboxamide synthase [Myxococcota bacterium]|jgi:phosphoribosylaminoimidazole-succinocarboxamide synthase
MERGALLYEGKAKQVYATVDPERVILRFKDDATAFNGVKKASIPDKGRLNCAFTMALFDVAEAAGVSHHVIEVLSPTDLLCERVTIIPVEVVVRNVAAGSFSRRYGVEEGTPLSRPLVEFFYKSDALDDPLLGRDVALLMGWAKAWELAFLEEAALALNAALVEFWGGHDIDLIDFKVEFGRANGRILLADEITPDGSRLWERGTRRRFDKDVFRRDIADLGDTYRALQARLNLGV